MIIFGFCFPWPYLKADTEKPADLSRAEFMKAATVINDALDTACKASTDEEFRRYGVYELRGLRKSTLDKLVRYGLVHLERAENGKELYDKMQMVAYPAQVGAYAGGPEFRDKLLHTIFQSAEHNKEIRGG